MSSNNVSALLLLKTNIHQYPTLRAAFQPDIALFSIQEVQTLPDPKVNMPDLRGAASVNETILHHRLNDKPRKILVLDSVITL